MVELPSKALPILVRPQPRTRGSRVSCRADTGATAPAVAEAPAIDPRLQQALGRIVAAWEHIPERRRDVIAECIPITSIVAAEVYGGWTPPAGWALGER